MIGHLFTPSEEHLQYRTFRFREPYQDCFVLQPGDEERTEPERPKSQASDQSSQPAKKKISLSDYKSKQANGVITPGSKKASPSLPPAKPLLANGTKKVDTNQLPKEKSDAIKVQKRSATEALGSTRPEKRLRDNTGLTVPQQATKTESMDSTKVHVDRSEPSNSTPHGLPPLLSPVEQSVNNPYGLPDILSPTLPTNIQTELDRLDEISRKRGNSNSAVSSSDTTATNNLLSKLHTEMSKIQKAQDARPVSANGKSPDMTQADCEPTPTQNLIVKLKYGKQNRTNVVQLLRLPPSRKPAVIADKKDHPNTPKERAVRPTTDESPARPKDSGKTIPRRPDSSASKAKVSNNTKVPEKRPRSESDVSSTIPAKRQKAQTGQEAPRTPAEHIATSPVVSRSSAQKNPNLFSTPRKEHRAINMLRTNSTEGLDSTPARSGNTPSSASKHLDVKGAQSSGSIDKKKQAEIQVLSQVSMKLNQMGRSLKHEAQRIFSDNGGHLNKEDQKRAAMITLECILSYMAAYHAQDESMRARGRPSDVEGTWKTLLPLCISFMRFTKDFPALDGLRLHLSAVISATICTQIAARSTRPKAHDSPQDIPQAELAKQLSAVTDNFALIADHHLKLLRYARDASNVFPSEDIQKMFPKTWVGKDSNAHFSREPEKFKGGKLSGPYYLPIQFDTTAIQAVRFGLKLLGEYGEKERLPHKLRVNLDKPE